MLKMMKTLGIVLGLMLCSNLALAQGKIAVISIQKAIINTEAAQGRLNEVRASAAYTESKKEFENLKKQGQDMFEKYQKDREVLSTEQRDEMERKMASIREDIEHVGRKLLAAEQEAGNEILQSMQGNAEQVIGDLIKNEGIGLLLNLDMQSPQQRQPLAWHADSSYDITGKVTDKLNQLDAAQKAP